MQTNGFRMGRRAKNSAGCYLSHIINSRRNGTQMGQRGHLRRHMGRTDIAGVIYARLGLMRTQTMGADEVESDATRVRNVQRFRLRGKEVDVDPLMIPPPVGSEGHTCGGVTRARTAARGGSCRSRTRPGHPWWPLPANNEQGLSEQSSSYNGIHRNTCVMFITGMEDIGDKHNIARTITSVHKSNTNRTGTQQSPPP
ncbi:hypothetical protein J6590_061879 [Homalodisca vitripennis]|nr:hypothetical protein J6590_061879 [Homalodisca vitripennis]